MKHCCTWVLKHLHACVQTAFLVVMCAVGLQFFYYVSWALQETATYVPKPPAVEAFLPISALLALKRFLLTGAWDPVHPAGLVIFCFALATGCLLRKSFCGYLCPIGSCSHALFWLGQRLGCTLPLPRWAMLLLCLPKYVLLAFFLSLPLFAMGLPEIEAFLFSRYNLVCDTKMLLFFFPPSASVLTVLFLLIVGSLFFPSFWCRAFCPYGALLGLLALVSPPAVTRDPARCVQCGACTAACPSAIPVHTKVCVRSPECTGCLACVRACPVPGSLACRVAGRRIPAWGIAAATIFLLVACVLTAHLTDHWYNHLPREQVRALHTQISSIGHF